MAFFKTLMGDQSLQHPIHSRNYGSRPIDRELH